MFSSLGWQEIVVILLVALVIFGPDKLPGAARQATDALKSVKKQISGARATVKEEFGDAIPADFDRTMLNPKAYVRKHLWEDDDEQAPDVAASNKQDQRPAQFDVETT